MFQADRSIAVDSPLGPDALLFRSMLFGDALGRPFSIDLELYSEDPAIVVEDVLGETMSVRLDQATGAPRYFHGYVTEFAQTETLSTRYAAYRATLRPWFWLLTRTADCRIYSGTVPEIAQEIFSANGFADFENRLQGSFVSREFCVQYRETAFNFVSRLFEQEGIYYYHSHDQRKHTLVMCNGYGSHQRIPGYESLPYYPRDPSRQRDREHISGWKMSKRVSSGMYVQRDYDFTKPKADLTADAALPREHSKSDYEIFDYPGEYTDKQEGTRYSQVRVEELQTDYERVECDSDARGLHAGGLFELTGFPRSDQNREYLIAAATIHLESNQYESQDASAELGYSCSLVAIDSRETFRPQRFTPKPVVSGPQTAVVVGKAGEEIWTDEHGRVKVQFHWDRYGTFDENSSCWIRVSHAWAGKEWGGLYLPRIGQEVIVEFLEADPDRPIITGRVYNGDNRPPYPLPANKTVSTMKSRSSLKGSASNFNEIKFDDKKGDELLFIQAEKNRVVKVKSNNTENVGYDETVTVGNNRTEKVGKAQQTTIGTDETKKIGQNQTVSVGQAVELTAGKEIVLKTGMAELSMSMDGTIKIVGTDLTVSSPAGKININPAGIITIQGTLVKIN